MESMELNVLGIIIAKGTPVDLAAYTMAVIEFLKAKLKLDEDEKVKDELKLTEMFRDITFEDLMKMEQDKEDK